MSKITAAFVALLLGLTLVACGSGDPQAGTETPAPSDVSSSDADSNDADSNDLDLEDSDADVDQGTSAEDSNGDTNVDSGSVDDSDSGDTEGHAVYPEEVIVKHSIDDPQSIWVISNKLRPLNPIDFEPDDLVYPEGVTNSNGQPLREVAAIAIEELVLAAANDGVYVGLTSAYRPYSLQETLYYSYIQRDGQELADRYSARPGHSEHQTGLVVDFDDFAGCGLMECFESTPAGIWLQEHAHEYGFVMRYPNGYEHVTGFIYEPWHYRYVGPELATLMREDGVLTLEEWFDLPPAPAYEE